MKEEKIVLELLKYEYDDSIIEILNDKSVNWITVLGYLMYHRVAGLVYEKINKIDVRLLDYPVFFASYMVNQAQSLRGKEQNRYVKIISDRLLSDDIDHVFLKGTVLNNVIYSSGERASNDIDILVMKQSVNQVAEILRDIGFVQGKYNYKKNEIIPFSSEEIRFSLENRGETAPFVLISDTYALKTIDVDINFSIDWIPDTNGDIVESFLQNKIIMKCMDGTSIYSLSNEHNFLELCIHLYKDSVLIDILKKRKVLDLYKFVDIYYFLKCSYTQMNYDKLYELVVQFNLEKPVLFAVRAVYTLFPDAINDKLDTVIEKILSSTTINENIIFDQYDESTMMKTTADFLQVIFSYDIVKLYH